MNVYIVGRDRLCATPHTDDGGKARSRKKRRLIEKNGLCNECFDRGCVDVLGLVSRMLLTYLPLPLSRPLL